MTFIQFLPVPIMVGILAMLSVWGANAIQVPVWPLFITWALFFLAGSRFSRVVKEVIGVIGGIAFGYITLWLAPQYTAAFGSVWGLPLTVFTVAFVIVLLEYTNWFELAPAYFFTFAGYFAYVFGGFGGSIKADYSNLMEIAANSLVPFCLISLAGLGFGIVTAALRKKILDMEGVYGDAQKTVFDKE